jgi:glutamyl-Q tRNA(Asp) synthetase
MTPQGASEGQVPISRSSTGKPPAPGPVVTRFAPSPTGRLHLGHAYSALLAHDFARERGGAFLLRIEDIDPGRTRAEFVAGIMADLAWLGLQWDGEVVLQSARLSLYREALARLVRRGLLYPCFCTRREIEAEIAASASAPHGPDGPVYPGTCRRLAEAQRERLLREKPHAWRLDMAAALTLLPGEGRGPGAAQGVASALPRESPKGLDPGLRGGALTWFDGGTEIPADPAQFGDVVLARKDAPVSYHLAVTVDDAAQGVTDVVRGEDLLAATHVHRLLQALLDLPSPVYRHHRLIAGADGQRLAKRHGAPTLADLRAGGADPRELAEKLRAGRLPAGYSTPAT